MRKITEKDFRGRKPFVIAVRGQCTCGCAVAVPIGVELAVSPQRAWSQAILRWPGADIAEFPWNSVPQDFRLAALEADRQM